MRHRPTFRFAPSPNGALHLGHALSALTGFDWARRLGGRFLVRIEDIDVDRTREPLVDAIFEDLTWLGLTWELPVLRQSQHFDAYRLAADRLSAMGVLYPCFASRTEIQAAAKPGLRDPDSALLYPGLHKTMSASEVAERRVRNEPFALRIDMDKALAVAERKLAGRPLSFTELDGFFQATVQSADPASWGDAVIVRKDVPTSYHLSVVVDDARQGITHVTRGRDLYPATDLHRLLHVLLDLPEPLYHHHRLLTDETGRKLAKSAGDTALRELRAQGWTPEDVHKRVGFATTGWSAAATYRCMAGIFLGINHGYGLSFILLGVS